ncbi:MAG: two-component regulator propeller domain-containing protein, partial [Rhodothermales bacterium]
RIYRIEGGADGLLWISTGNGLNRMDLKRPGRFTRFLVGPEGDVGESSNPGSQIGDVLEREEEPEIAWVATGGGLMRLNVETGEFRNVYPHVTGDIAVDPDDDDVLWLTTFEEGLVRFDLASETATRFRHDAADPRSLSTDRTEPILTDRSGTIWVGTILEGVTKFNPSAISFARIVSDPKNPSLLANSPPWGLLVDRRGGLWIAGAGRPVMERLDLATGRVERWEGDPDRPTNPNGPAGFMFTFAEDADGGIWIATNRGLNRFDPVTRKFALFRHNPDDEHSLTSDNLRTVYVDREGFVWAGAAGSGVNRLDPESGVVTRFVHVPSDSNTINGPSALAIYEDSEGSMWIGTANGISRIDKNNEDRITRYSHDRKNPLGITRGAVSYIHERKAEPGVLWLSTSGGGLDRMDVRTGTFRHYTEMNSGLPNNTVYAALEDRNGRLWMSTNHGISRFDPETETFTNYGIEHGLQSLEFNQWSAAVAPDGEMFFGGVNGINSFHPDAVRVNEMAPPVALTDLRLLNAPVAPGPGSPLQQALSRTREMSLTYDQARNVGFDFVALHYKNSAKNRYAYRLEGFDGDWIAAGSQRSATYTNLPPGKYTFRVKASNSDGVWNEEGAALVVTVLPPWWRTMWAYAAYGLLLLGAVVTVDRTQRPPLRKKALLEQAELRAKAAESERLAADARAHAAESQSEAADARAQALAADNERKKDAELLGEIGKEITSTLDLETIFDRVYEHVNRLVKAPVFGIGLYSEEREQIDYRLAMENGKRYAPYSRDISDKNQFPVWCIEHRAPVFVNDVETEY